jgi:hypothetical protein
MRDCLPPDSDTVARVRTMISNLDHNDTLQLEFSRRLDPHAAGGNGEGEGQ